MGMWLMGSTFGHRNNDTNNNTTNSSERQFDPYNILQLQS
jgi:hypothetical protein